jgi:DNA-binding NtrC family response regulator
MASPPGGGDTNLPHRARNLLIVEPDRSYRDLLHYVAADHGNAEAVDDFHAAYTRITSTPPDLLLTNLRLQGDMDGLRLAAAAAKAGRATRTVVYTDRVDRWATNEVQRTGAFYETQLRLVVALPSYVRALDLPVLDRRNPWVPDRRGRYRGGRRAWDVPLAAPKGGRP